MPSKKSKSPSSLADLPQKPETWYLVTRQLSIWLEDGTGEVVRPYILLLALLSEHTAINIEVTPDLPAVEQIGQFLTQVMLDPPEETSLQPHRPQRIEFEHPEYAPALASMLNKISIQVGHAQPPKEINNLVGLIEEGMLGDQAVPGLLSIEGVTPDLIGDLFAAAAEFYRSAPWQKLVDTQPLAIDFNWLDKEGYVQVMGNAGMEFGLLLYWDMEDLLRIFQYAADPLEQMPAAGWCSFTFTGLEFVPVADREAVEKYGWELISADKYPLPLTYFPDSVVRPSRDELIIYEAILRGVSRFVDQHLESDDWDDYKPVEVELTVPTFDGSRTLNIRYPVSDELLAIQQDMLDMFSDEGGIDVDLESIDADFTLPFDPRMMEREMREFAGMAPGDDDPALFDAQQLIYDAWGQPDPERRIELARKALEISPHCADAYSLLAEDQADTVQAAMEYFEKGVQVAEAALGEAFFEENTGMFWGLLETRPYMRCRAGLAGCLWELDRTDEALDHYRDMLRLNPDDNQGLRYLVLNLLLQEKQEDEAEKLLDEYSEESSAVWCYTRALIAFRKTGPSQEANSALKEALEQNPHVPAYLLGQRPAPIELPAYMGWGDDSEAVHYVADSFSLWWGTPGAADWLRTRVDPAHKRSKPGRKKKTSRGRRRKG